VPELPETLLADREREYVGWFLKAKTHGAGATLLREWTSPLGADEPASGERKPAGGRRDPAGR
jgi:hypothetical protein